MEEDLTFTLGENNWFMNWVFQTFFNLDELREWIDAITFVETNEAIAEKLQKLVRKYLEGGTPSVRAITETNLNNLNETKKWVLSTKVDQASVDIKKFRQAFSYVYPSIGQMNSTGDALWFWTVLIQIINSVLISGSALKISDVKDSKDENCSMIYQKLGIKYIASRNSDDYNFKYHYTPILNVDILYVVNEVQNIMSACKNLTETTSKLDYKYNLFKKIKTHGTYGQTNERRNEWNLTLENIPQYFTFHCSVGKDIDADFGEEQIKIFADMLSLRITVDDIFDNYVDEDDDDFDETTDTKSLDDHMYKLVSIILYWRGHYFTCIYNDSNWVIYDDKLVVSKEWITFNKIKNYITETKSVPLIIWYEYNPLEIENLKAITSFYEMFESQLLKDSSTRSIEKEISTFSYSRDSVERMINVIAAENVDEFIMENLCNLQERIL